LGTKESSSISFLIMTRFYIQTTPPEGTEKGEAYQFNGGPLDYPAAMAAALGVSVDVVPNNYVPTTIGTYADYPIVRLRLTLDNGKSITRLCDADFVATAMSTLPGLNITTRRFTGDIVKVAPARTRVRV
jgi:hypothetical protein